MAITSYTVNDTSWTAITAAGESGTCWLQQKPEEGRVVIHHSDSGTGSLDIEDGYFLPDNKSETVTIVADNPSDIYYARCVDADESAKVCADVL